MAEFKSFKGWQRHVDRLLKFNHTTISVSAGKPSSHFEETTTLLDTMRTNKIASINKNRSSVSIQYSFKHSSFLPSKFMNSRPQFQPEMDLSVRNLPCLIFLHGSAPGGFDVSRWMASGIAQIQNIWDPVSRYSALNLYDAYHQDSGSVPRSKQSDLHSAASKYDYFNIFKPGYYDTDIRPPKPQDHPPQFFPLGMLNLSRPGYLESVLTIEDTFHSEALSMIRLLDNLSIRSIRIIAHGTASLAAMELASLPHFRDRVRSLVMIDPVLTNTQESKNQLVRSGLIPSYLKNRYYYSKIRKGPNSAEFENFVGETCGPAAVKEMKSDIGLLTLYKNLGVLFSRHENRKLGITSDIIKLKHFARNESQIRHQWTFVNSPILVVNTSSTQDEYNNGKLSYESEILVEQRKSALLNTGSNILQFHNVIGGGNSMYPVGEVSSVILDFLRNHGFIN